MFRLASSLTSTHRASCGLGRCRQALSSSAVRCCATPPTAAGADINIAPKKAAKRRLNTERLDIEKLVKAMPKDPQVKAELTTSELERKVEEWSKMTPEELDALYKQLEDEEQAENRVLGEDSLYQMDVSLKTSNQGAVKVFWKDVSVVPSDKQEGWYNVAVDGRKVKAFESTVALTVPDESFAYSIAKEWSEQEGFLNKLLMPMTDLASGAMHVPLQNIQGRIDYMMSFFANDNLYFRSEAIQDEQDEMIKPIVEWYGRMFDMEVPRIVGIGHPGLSPVQASKVRDVLVSMNLNQYQAVAMCVVAQYTSSLMLPLAMFNRVIDIPTALKINRAEEFFNIRTHGEIKGYHDIREADLVVKLCACASAWQMTKEIPLSVCSAMPRITTQEEMDTV